jgi:sec-independent protein translocase protein TatC
MPLLEHLRELRKRLLISLSVFISASAISLPLAPFVLNRMREDLMKEVFFIVLSPQEALMVEIKVSLLMGFIRSFPVSVYQMWAFIAPGLLGKEKKILSYVLLPSIVLFLLGAGFAYYLLLPVTLSFLISVAYTVAFPLFSLNQTLNFIIPLILSFGLVFQLPLIVAVLSKLGVVNPCLLTSKRRYVILLTFLVAAVITDPSVVTQILVAIPIILLYEMSIQVSKLLGESR